MASTKISDVRTPGLPKPSGGTDLVRRLKNNRRVPITVFKFLNRAKEEFECPLCGYKGPFRDRESPGGFRKHAICPNCSALERHRLQYLVVNNVLRGLNVREMKALHFAPETFFKSIFCKRFQQYETADLFMQGVDHKADLQNLPFNDETYDFIFASHVLEHIPNDRKAIQEIRRVLRPNGIAILPVPVICTETIEYPEANPREEGHVRAPGSDYFERYKQCFSKVEIFASDLFPAKYQLFVYENRSAWPTKDWPLRQPMQGEKHPEYVPVCHA